MALAVNESKGDKLTERRRPLVLLFMNTTT